MFKSTTRKQMLATFKPCLEVLEERCLLDANPNPYSQLAVSLGQLGVAELRLFVDGAIILDGAAAAAGAEFPPITAGAITTLVALEPVMHDAARAYDIASLVSDLREGNIAGAAADAAGLFKDTVLNFAGDLAAVQQDQAAVATALTRIMQAPSTTQPSPTPATSPSPSPSGPGVTNFGNYPTGSFTDQALSYTGGLTAQNVIASGTTLSGQLKITQFELMQGNSVVGTADGTGIITGTLQSNGLVSGTFSFNLDTSAYQSSGLPAVTHLTANVVGTLNQNHFTGTLADQGGQFGTFTMSK